MIRGLNAGVECIPVGELKTLYTRSDILWIHLHGRKEFDALSSVLQGFSYGPNLRLVMTSGFKSEEVHDRVDDLIEDNPLHESIILTVWSEADFSDALWEFTSVHGSHQQVRSAKLIIIVDSVSIRMKMLNDISSVLLGDM